MYKQKMWISNTVSTEEAERIAKRAGISTLMAKVLINRGFREEAAIKRFLSPMIDELNDPYLLNDMDTAVDRILKAVDTGEGITIFGDYDVDGITSTSILYDYLKNEGGNIDYYIPDRLEEGYGLSVDAIDRIKLRGGSLVITVDCGITAFDEVTHAVESGLDIIITDHHECMNQLPRALAVINPCRSGSTYPFKELAGVGVAFKLLEALSSKRGCHGKHLNYLDLVTLGTIADVVPLLGENRVIARYGMPIIGKTANLGLRTLIEHSGLKDKPINSFSISFVLAPRINAAGRLGDASRAVKLFTTEDPAEALAIVSGLNEENKLRQDTEQLILEEAVSKIEAGTDLERERVIVVAGEGWHHGIIGIVASKIVERYYRPCILFSIDDGIAKGSGRSIEGFNMFEALQHCGQFLEKYGGHELAAGMSLKSGRLEEFRKALNEYACTTLSEKDLVPKLKIDAFINSTDITLDNVTQLEMMAPFGAGNPGPVLACNRVKLADTRAVGENKHLKMKLNCGDLTVDAIGFNMGDAVQSYLPGDMLDTAFSLEVNTWNSINKVQLNLRDIKPCEEIIGKNSYLAYLDKCIVLDKANDYNKINDFLDIAKQAGREYYGLSADERVSDSNLLGELVPVRSELVAVYQYLKANCRDEMQLGDLYVLARRISENYKICMNYFKLKKCLDIFSELSLLKVKTDSQGKYIILMDFGFKGKTNLERSKTYMWLRTLNKHI